MIFGLTVVCLVLPGRRGSVRLSLNQRMLRVGIRFWRKVLVCRSWLVGLGPTALSVPRWLGDVLSITFACIWISNSPVCFCGISKVFSEGDNLSSDQHLADCHRRWALAREGSADVNSLRLFSDVSECQLGL